MNQRTQIDLLRHGELETPALFCAKSDEPLSDKGLQDLLKTTKNGTWDFIISSPYKRCQDFAKTLVKQKECELIIDPAFQEMDFGRWTGIPTKTLWEQESASLKNLWDSPELFIAPSGESMSDFTQRIKKGWQALLAEYENSNVLLITHAGVIRTVLTEALKMSHQSALSFNIEYAHLSQLHYYSDGVYSLRSHGLSHCKKESK